MAKAIRRPRREQPKPTWDLVRKRNYVERLKHDKAPMEVINDLPDLIDQGYEEISEEDVVRLQWYGLYHDKPKVGHFMMRVKLPGGRLTPYKLRTIGRVSQDFGGDYGELTTRQNIQLHGMKLNDLPRIFETLNGAGLSTSGGCGDTVRNITGCPVAGLAADELFNARPVIEAVADFFYGNPDYCDLPRKHKITISCCPLQCNAPEINCISLIGIKQAGNPGFAVRIGGGLSTWPRLSSDLGVFVPVNDVIPVLRAIIDVWKEDLKYRMSRVKARLKFMVADLGVETYRERVETRLGYRLDDGEAPAPPEVEHDHTGIHEQVQEGLYYAGFPVFLGLCTGTQMIQLADLADQYGGEFRLTRRQNVILTDIPG
ncbi:MAG: nitrite/sulfite reductase, partial [candidate division Zixibacteria bacterium]|nr:nitrite/sulfite reductase [candidate division Zixibacteria bacterium]